MAELNRVILIGNLTRDPEVRRTQNGSPVASIGIAVNESYKSKSGERKSNTLFISVEVWGTQAENAGKYLKKGAAILVEGKLKMDSWETDKGEKRNQIKVSALSIQFMDKKSATSANKDTQAKEESKVKDSDIPF